MNNTKAMRQDQYTAIVMQNKDDGSYFAFIKDLPAAAVSATNLADLDKRLKRALAEVIEYATTINYNLFETGKVAS